MNEKVKVRIAVAVDKNGKWVAYAHDAKESWDDCMEFMLDDLHEGESRYWVEAELEIPRHSTVVGVVAKEPTP